MAGALSIGGTAVKADDLPLGEINTSDHPFSDDVPVKFTIPLPPKGRALGIELPGDIRNNAWILSIDNVEPHSAKNVISLLQGKQQCGKTTDIVIYLAKRGSAPHCKRIEKNCQIFKQVRFKPTALLISKSAAFICFDDAIPPISRKIFFHHITLSRHQSTWETSAKIPSMQNGRTLDPCHCTDIPPGAKVLCAQPAFK
eukprot:8462901-Ditylum_brightwellii.AAC.1